MYENNMNNIIEAQTGNKEAMGKLVEINNGLIWSIVRRFKDRGYELEDLYQIGCMGFIKSIKRFDITMEVKLSTYAVPYILGEIKRFIRDDGPIKISRSTKELLVKIREIEKHYQDKIGREVTINEIAEELGVEKEEIAYALTTTKPIESINEEIYDDNGRTTLIDKIASNKNEENETINNILLKNSLSSLNKNERQVIMLRYFNEKTQTQVAEILGISQVQVSRMEKKILNNLKIKITGGV